MRLKEWQSSLEAYLLAADSQPTAALLASLQGSATLDVATGLAIYHNAYRARLQETLRGDFPALLQGQGEDTFAQLAGDYLHANPSEHFSLRWLGARFAAFIEGYPQLEERAAWAELARLEWAFTLAFDAPPGTPLTLAQMATLPPAEWPELRVKYLPSVQPLVLHCNSLARWRAHKNDEPLLLGERLPVPQLCLVWRHELQGQFRTVGADEAQALRQMTEENYSFAALCLSLAHLEENAAAQAAGWLKQWLSEGLLARAE